MLYQAVRKKNLKATHLMTKKMPIKKFLKPYAAPKVLNKKVYYLEGLPMTSTRVPGTWE
jgi:hypothetical protein